jgi:DNA-binding winged helix-turn-helix (wHTH) protein
LKRDAGVTSFGACTLDGVRRELRVRNRPRHLSPRAFTLLELLLGERPRALSREELRSRLWPDTYVSNTSLAQLVTELRKAIGDDAREGRWIRTVFGYGYAFGGEATSSVPAPPPRPDEPRCWLRRGDNVMPLRAGANEVGRAPDAQIRLLFGDVSRRHACIVVSEEGATLEDLGSRNGTFLAGRPVTAPVALSDGDVVAIGKTVLVFIAPSGVTTTGEGTGDTPDRDRE